MTYEKGNTTRSATDSSWASLDCATAREGSQGEQEVEDGAADLLQINCSAPGGPELRSRGRQQDFSKLFSFKLKSQNSPGTSFYERLYCRSVETEVSNLMIIWKLCLPFHPGIVPVPTFSYNLQI